MLFLLDSFYNFTINKISNFLSQVNCFNNFTCLFNVKLLVISKNKHFAILIPISYTFSATVLLSLLLNIEQTKMNQALNNKHWWLSLFNSLWQTRYFEYDQLKKTDRTLSTNWLKLSITMHGLNLKMLPYSVVIAFKQCSHLGQIPQPRLPCLLCSRLRF